MASFIAAGTAYATHGVPMIPFFIFYSMFGFQRIGDLIWAVGDERGRGFLLGAAPPAARRSNGEGLQHQDGHRHVLASTVPNCLAYDPAFAYELAVILRTASGACTRSRRTSSTTSRSTTRTTRCRRCRRASTKASCAASTSCGRRRRRRRAARAALRQRPILREALRAQELLAERFGVAADVWSVTSYKSCAARRSACERWNLLHPGETREGAVRDAGARSSAEGPVVAATDYMRLVPDQIARWVPQGLTPLGTDGFGRSDTREALRRFFEVDAESIAIAALAELAKRGKLPADVPKKAIAELGLDPEKAFALLS